MTQDSQSFWEKQAKEYKTAFEKLDELAGYLERTERRHLFNVIHVDSEMSVLDLGCGTGRWAFEFAKRCKHVTATDFATGMIERARQGAEELGLHNIDFEVSSVQDFNSSQKFDIIIISGVLVYFNDEQLPGILANLRNHLKPNGKVISRETVAIKSRWEVNDQFHDKIGDTYSATYRLPEEYRRAFEQAGLREIYANDFTPTNFPMILYRRLVPNSLKSFWPMRKLLQLGLAIQYALDPFLLRHKSLYRPIMNRFWKIKSMLFVYGID